MSWEQRNADFCNAQTDAQMAYIEAEREVDRLQTENDKLRELVSCVHEGGPDSRRDRQEAALVVWNDHKDTDRKVGKGK